MTSQGYPTLGSPRDARGPERGKDRPLSLPSGCARVLCRLAERCLVTEPRRNLWRLTADGAVVPGSLWCEAEDGLIARRREELEQAEQVARGIAERLAARRRAGEAQRPA